ncbi:MAG: DUF3000 domain-containing protein [Corynebacterium sp.]|nr:DUF3000 domain-containing protein [Corynebacterium sp.]
MRLVSISDAPTQHSASAPTPLHGRARSTKASQSASADNETSPTSATPAAFTSAVESMHSVSLRPEITLGTIRPPQKLAPYSHAVGLEVGTQEDFDSIPVDTEGDAFGRLILLHDPGAEEAWEGSMRLVAYIQADMDSDVAGDPLLPDVAWQWLNESLSECGATHTNLGGTVTSTTSVRFGEIGGPPRAHQLEMRASWTAEEIDLSQHVAAFAQVLANVAGLPPEGITQLGH